METRTVEQVKSWDSRPFSGGYADLRELADGEFSGAVHAGGAWLFMLNGRVVGVFEGSLEDFEQHDGTVFAAPHPSLPLLFSMQEQGGETQARYYTNDTSLSEADSTLSSGKFTGYVELSENVLSGDYYAVYYGGRSMNVAFVGGSDQLLTGDEAFERADDEVGIYEVKNVDIEVIDVPEPEESETEQSAAPADDGGDDGTAEQSERRDETGDEPQTPERAAADPQTGESAADPQTGESAADPSPDSEPTDPASASATETGESAADTSKPEAASANERRRTQADAASQTPETESAASDSEPRPDARGPQSSSAEQTPGSGTGGGDAPETSRDERSQQTQSGAARTKSKREQAADDREMFDEEAQWQDTTAIPSLNPDRSTTGAGAGGGGEAAQATVSRSNAQTKTQTKPRTATESASASASAPNGSAPDDGRGRAEAGQSSARADADGRVQELRAEIQDRESKIKRLRDKLGGVQSERDELKRERDALQQEVTRLEARLETASASDGGTRSQPGGQQISPAQAFGETNLFVRYGSKGKETLEEARAGEADREAVNANLKLEHHTQFDADAVTVEGQSFDSFLRSSFEYQFVEWVVQDLLYEIRDTGHQGSMKDIYNALPDIDRAELHGTVTVEEDDAETDLSFDIIMRDRMGNPLVVANLNDSRDPATGDMMASLVEASSAVSESHDTLSCSFQVTQSFFKPKALETAEEATSGGLLSREKRSSFVKLSRKRGYHLCLVESRDGQFYLNVPEL